MNIKQILLRSISIMYLIIILMGCGGGEQQTGGGLQEAKGGKFKGGIYRANEMAELRSLDPVGVNDATSHHIADQIYETLLTYDGDLRLQPELAESWEVSPDGMSYTYRLRKGVKFHDDPCFKNGKGRELTAQDVVYSFTRICDARTRTLGAEYFKEKVRGAKEYYDASIEAQANNAPIKVSGIPGFVAVDNYTFRIDLVKPFAPFEFYVTLGVTLIHPKEAVEKYGKDFFQHPVGTGPFKFVSWSPERECVLTRNTHYWGKDKDGNQLPYLDGITFSFMKDITNQFVACKNGNLEESYRIPSEFFEDVVDQNKKVKPAYANYKVLNIPALSTQYYGMLYSGKVFGNINLRKALNMGIDRSQIRKFVLKSQSAGPGIHGLVPPTMVDYNGTQIKGYDFDLEQARALLAQAGYPGGKGLEITLQLNNGGGRNLQLAEAIQSQLKKNLGIEVKLKQVEFARHLDEVDAGKVEFFRLGWIADYPDPESFLNLLYGKLVPTNANQPSPINHTRYKNPAFDVIFEQALSETDRLKRMELYRKAEQIAINDAPMMVLQYDEDWRLVQDYVEGYVTNAMDKRMYKFIWFNPAKMQ